MNSYRVRLITDRNPQIVDVLADSPHEASLIALSRNGNAVSAMCVGLTEELERLGRERVGREHFA